MNTPTNVGQDTIIALLHGPSIEVVIQTPSGNETSWHLPKALLLHHCGYFQRACRFKEGEEKKITLRVDELTTWTMFVEFAYYGQYKNQDDLKVHNKVRDSARAWILGDYLDAVQFKNYAMRQLYNIYFPGDGDGGSGHPAAGIGPKTVEHCYGETPVGSHLRNLYLNFAERHWHTSYPLMNYDVSTIDEWNLVWDHYPEFRNDLLYTNQPEADRWEGAEHLCSYFEEGSIVIDKSERESLMDA